MKLLPRLSTATPQVIAKTNLRRFVDEHYGSRNQLWIAADALGRHVILHKNRIPIPLTAGFLWRRALRNPRVRGVMLAGAVAAEAQARDEVRAQLRRIGRDDLPIRGIFSDLLPDWYCGTRFRRLLHLPAIQERHGPPLREWIVVLAAPRTGSTMLSELLVKAGIAPGTPKELFHNTVETYHRHGLVERRRVVRRYLDFYTGEDGVCAVKIQGNQFVHLVRKYDAAADLIDIPRLRDARVIRLRRRDRIAQAVSWHRARRDKVWHLRPGKHAPDGDPGANRQPSSDGRLRKSLREVERDERLVDFAGRHFFDAARTIEVFYEDLVADMPGEMTRICAHLGHDMDGETAARLEPETRPLRQIYGDDDYERLNRLAGR